VGARDRLAELRAIEAQESTAPAETPAEPTKQERLAQLRELEVQEGDVHGIGKTEAIATIASGAIAEPIAGLAGIVQAVNPFAEEGAGAQAVEDVRSALTYKPRSEFAKDDLGDISEVVEPAAKIFSDLENTLGDFALEQTGSPALAAAAKTSPTAILEILGLGAIKKIKPNTRLLDEYGRPTLKLEMELDKKGLNFDNLLPEVRAEIPDVTPSGIMPRLDKAGTSNAAEQALVSQIKAGGRDDALAGLKVVGNKIEPDNLGVEAIKQGFDESFVQAVKTASTETKKGLLKMTNIMQQIGKNKRLGLDIRPTDIVGDAVTSRIKYIRDKANTARLKLNVIADKTLRNKQVDVEPVISQLQKSLDELDIDLIGEGIPTPVFKGSMISKDKTSQRVITDLIDLMGEGGKPDALRFHKLKRQIDRMIDFNKKSADGLTDAGRDVLRDIRTSLNETLRKASPEYAEVNDVLSSSLTALDEFKSVSGSSIDIFGKGSNQAIGQDMRGLMSNRKSRVKLENALSKVEDVAVSLGGNFTDDIKDLSLFANQLETRFGTVASTSMKGDIGAVLEQAMNKSAAQNLKEKVFKKTVEKANKLKGINDFNAYKAMRDLAKAK